MTPATASKRILLVGDSPDVVEETRALIKDVDARVTVAEPARIVAAFDEAEPQILLLAFMEISEAEGCYLDLYRSAKKIQTTLHNSLLVCKAKDAETAYRLRMRKLFDDYVVIRPLHDPFRLSISIRNLLAAQESGEASAELRQLMASIRSSASAMDGLVRESLREGATIRARLVESGETLKARMRENLQALAGQMAAPEFAGVVSVNDQAALGERLSRFAEEKLAGEVASQLQPAEAALTDLLKRSAADYTATAEANAGVSAWLDAVKPQVLVVDDDAFYLTVLTRMLAGEGFEIVTATDPLEGLNLAVRLRPAAIMVDFEMPGMTGLDFIARVRSAPRLAGTPVLMLTGHAERELVQKAIAAGVSGYLIKPGNKETLLKKLRQHIAQSVPAKHAPATGQRA